ncbi:hypothetical protein BH20ACT2_BH20ACT2_20420 [soil metagenome]
MCATCVAQGGPYVLGSLVALRAMGAGARRGRRRAGSDEEPTAADELVASAPTSADERSGASPLGP